VKELDEGVQGYQKVPTKGKVQVHNLSPGMVFTQVKMGRMTMHAIPIANEVCIALLCSNPPFLLSLLHDNSCYYKTLLQN
jgi:hypothetical protein